MKVRALEIFRRLHVYHPRCMEIMGGGEGNTPVVESVAL